MSKNKKDQSINSNMQATSANTKDEVALFIEIVKDANVEEKKKPRTYDQMMLEQIVTIITDMLSASEQPKLERLLADITVFVQKLEHPAQNIKKARQRLDKFYSQVKQHAKNLESVLARDWNDSLYIDYVYYDLNECVNKLKLTAHYVDKMVKDALLSAPKKMALSEASLFLESYLFHSAVLSPDDRLATVRRLADFGAEKIAVSLNNPLPKNALSRELYDKINRTHRLIEQTGYEKSTQDALMKLLSKLSDYMHDKCFIIHSSSLDTIIGAFYELLINHVTIMQRLSTEATRQHYAKIVIIEQARRFVGDGKQTVDTFLRTMATPKAILKEIVDMLPGMQKPEPAKPTHILIQAATEKLGDAETLRAVVVASCLSDISKLLYDNVAKRKISYQVEECNRDLTPLIVTALESKGYVCNIEREKSGGEIAKVFAHISW